MVQKLVKHSPTEVDKQCPECSNSGPSSRLQAPVFCELRGIYDPVADTTVGMMSEECDDVQESGPRSCASRRTAGPATNGGRCQCRRPHGQFLDVDTALTDQLMCRDDEKLEESLPKRRAVRTLAARRSCQTALGTFLSCVKERALRGGVFINSLCPGNSASP